MKKIPLALFVKEKGQRFAANALGVSSPAISKALMARREIQVTCLADGTFEALELRKFPSQSASKPEKAA
jgi:hypothetical protein